MATAGSIVVDLVMRTGMFETDSKRAEKRLREMTDSAEKFGKQVGTVFAASAVAAASALSAITARAIEQMDKLDELSARFGVATETLSTWGYAAERSGTSLEALVGAVPKLSKAMVEAVDRTSQAAELFRALGVDVLDPLTGKVRKVEEILPALADAFKVLDDDTTEAALALQLLGKSGTELLEFMNRGSSGIAELQERARALGVEIDGNTAAAAARFKDELDDLKGVVDGLGIQLAGRLAPALADTTAEFRGLVQEGEFAANVVSVVDGAMRAGVWAIEAYNQAVENTAIGFEMLNRYAASTVMIARNLATLGFADGSVLDGLRGQIDAIGDGVNSRDAAIAARRQSSGAAAPKVLFAGEEAEPAGFFAKSEAELRLEEQRDAMEERIHKLLQGRGPASSGQGGSAAQKAVQELQRLADAQAGWNDRLLDMEAALAGPVAQATREYQREMGALEEAFQSGEVKLRDYAAMQEVLTAKRDKELEAIRAQKTPFQEMVEDLEFERELIGLGNEQREIAIAQRWAGVDAMSAEGRELTKLIAGNRQLDEIARAQVDAMDSLRDAGADFFTDWTSGAKGFKDAALDALDSLRDRILSMIAENLMDQLFGKRGDAGGGAWGDVIGGILGAMFGGARAGGGDVSNGRAYLVGEEGPEMFVPRTAGTIIPAGQTAALAAGGGGFNQTLIFQTQGRIDHRTRSQMAADQAVAAQSLLARNGRGGRG